jgi:hypothetical protein
MGRLDLDLLLILDALSEGAQRDTCCATTPDKPAAFFRRSDQSHVEALGELPGSWTLM